MCIYTVKKHRSHGRVNHNLFDDIQLFNSLGRYFLNQVSLFVPINLSIDPYADWRWRSCSFLPLGILFFFKLSFVPHLSCVNSFYEFTQRIFLSSRFI